MSTKYFRASLVWCSCVITVWSSLQKFNKLVDRVNVAKADTEDALQRIKSNTNELDDALNTLKGRPTENTLCFL